MLIIVSSIPPIPAERRLEIIYDGLALLPSLASCLVALSLALALADIVSRRRRRGVSPRAEALKVPLTREREEVGGADSSLARYECIAQLSEKFS